MIRTKINEMAGNMAGVMLEAVHMVGAELDALTGDKELLSANIELRIGNIQESLAAVQQFVQKTEADLGGDPLMTMLQGIYSSDVSAYKSSLHQKSSAAKQYRQEQIAAVKEACRKEIAIIEKARDEEIALYKDKVYSLSRLLKETKIRQKDEEELRNIEALKENLRFEKDDANRYYIGQALASAQESYANRKETEAIQSEIEYYKQMVSQAKELAAAEIEAAKAYRDDRIAAINVVEEAQSDSMNNMSSRQSAYKNSTDSAMDDMVRDYGKMALEVEKIAEETAVKVTAAVREGQNANINTILAFTSRYLSAGKSLGGAFAAAFNSGLEAVQGQINSIGSQLEAVYGSGSFSTIYGQSGSENNTTTNSLGGITQNFYTSEVTPYEARKMAEDIIRTVL